MRVWLDPETEGWIKELVDSGRYDSPGNVVADAVYFLVERERIREMRLEHLRKEVQKGLDSGPGKPLDVEALKERIHARLAAEQDDQNQCHHTL